MNQSAVTHPGPDPPGLRLSPEGSPSVQLAFTWAAPARQLTSVPFVSSPRIPSYIWRNTT